MTNEPWDAEQPGFASEDEIDEVLGSAYPNPERVGCPPREVLIALSRRQRPIGDAGYQHIVNCSPCYREFRAFQRERPPELQPDQRRLVWWFGAAAAVVLVAAGAWFLLQGNPPGHDLGESPTAVQTAELHTEVDLRSHTVARSDSERPERAPVPLARGRLTMTILLPIGFEPGDYELQVLDSDLRSRAAASGQAEIRDFITTLEATMDLGSLPPGPYQLAIRRIDEDWHLFPALVQ